MTEIAERFVGSWKLEKNEKLEEFMAAKGVPWMIRKIAKSAGATKHIKSNGDQSYTIITESPRGKEEWRFKLGECFDAKGQDGKDHRITFIMEDDGVTLNESHIVIETGKAEKFSYTFEGDKLVHNMFSDKVHCKRFFNKI